MVFEFKFNIFVCYLLVLKGITQEGEGINEELMKLLVHLNKSQPT
jgi:hypothetical protein